MKLFNSLHNKIEEFIPIHEKHVDMYVCGPTVYNYSHIGNARPIVVFDTLQRMFIALGYSVKMVSNYTDIDDKIIKVAKELHMEEKEVTEKFIQAYQYDRTSLHALRPSEEPLVTQMMDDIIHFIELLIAEGYAYEIDGDVYFEVAKVENYGELSNQKREDLIVGARIEENINKKNPLDFTLWKKTKEGIAWNSPWSKGRPGWHTECVVMIQKEFQTSLIDIHGGGMDLKFPHHENEMAQAKVLCHSTLANYWVHNGMVNFDGIKMSKSLGNIIWTKDLVATIGGNTLRWLMLSTHYRAPLNISDESIKTAQKELQKITSVLKQVNSIVSLSEKYSDCYDLKIWQRFLDEVQEDMNVANGMMIIFEVVKQMNVLLREAKKDVQQLICLENTMYKMLDVLGILLQQERLQPEDKLLYQKWQEAVRMKDFIQADTYRKQLIEKKIL